MSSKVVIMAGGYHGLREMNVFFGSGSPHPHLTVHEHREEPVAEGGEFLVLENEVLCSGVSMSVDANEERWIDD